ncbi:hypothetical protein FHW58_005376 [Duganella sp. 1224]|uniref:hypothetical protein n=1 Tax=Duganella sp. 1224 TaxID=2587052 RepID=UPI0015C8D286|nr:hypothetical protein [Duganella sp. 1224]NYE64141.1 hypothetical protein [Duganella sp. 1224]
MGITNHLGNLGEDLVSLLFRRRIDNAYRFSTTFLGEKAQLLDFMVNLLDDSGSAYGPFFFLQVKATNKPSPPGQLIPARFTSDEVKRALARRCPVYLVAVACVDDDSEEVFVIAVETTLTGGVAGVPRLFSLSETGTRLQIYKEVQTHFGSKMASFESLLTRKAHAQKTQKRSHDGQP